MKQSAFFKLGSLDKLAKLVKRSVSTIRRWKREGIPKSSQEKVKKLLKKPAKKPKKEPKIVPLTAREKKQMKEQKRLALEERKRILLKERQWVREILPQEYTQNRIVALYNAIEQNKKNLKHAKGKRKKRLQLTISIGKQMVQDWLDGYAFVNPNLIEPLLEEYALEESEAYREIYDSP